MTERLRVTILTSGYLPVPDVRGGAVESLCTSLMRASERHEDGPELTVITCAAPGLEEAARTLPRSRILPVRIPLLVTATDRLLYTLVSHLRPTAKNSGFRFLTQRLWFIWRAGALLADDDGDLLVIENHPTLLAALRRRHGWEHWGGRVCYHAHNDFAAPALLVRDLSRVTAVLGVSRFVLDYVDERLRQVGQSALSERARAVWHNGIDQSVYAPERLAGLRQAARTRLGVCEDDVLVLFHGRVTPGKGVEELVRAFSKAAQDRAHLHLLVAGAFASGEQEVSPFERHLRELAAPCGGRVQFSGYLPHEEIPEVLAASDICCVPSVSADAAPLAVIEALAAGRVLVTTRIGGIPEYADASGAVVLELGDDLVSRLAQTLVRLADDPKERARRGQQARRRAAGLTDEAYYERFIELMTALAVRTGDSAPHAEGARVRGAVGSRERRLAAARSRHGERRD